MNTSDKEKAIELYYSDKSFDEIKTELGKSSTWVYTTWKEAGLPKRLTQLQKQVKELREQGFCCSEIADLLGKDTKNISTVARAIKMPFTPEETKKSITLGHKKMGKTITKSDDEVSKTIQEKIPGFEYAGNYTGTDGTVDLRCTTCGTIITRSMITVRHRNVRCEKCYSVEKLLNNSLRYAAKVETRLIKQKQHEEQKKEKFWSKSFEQSVMKICPVCQSVFVGGERTKYCSTKCANQNKWHMKDGYRYLFPLQEVFDRDNGICYLCGKPYDWDDFKIKDGVIVYGNNYPSRDHVVPKSKGGDNSWNNIRLAHRLCNSLKYNDNTSPHGQTI